MQIKYIGTKEIDEKFIDNYSVKDDIGFNIYGRYKNLLFLADDYIRIYDTVKNEFVRGDFIYGNKIHYAKKTSQLQLPRWERTGDFRDDYYFFQYHQDKDGNIDSICIYDEEFNIKKFLSLKKHADFGLRLNVECLSSNNTEEKYYVKWSYRETPSSSCRIDDHITFIINKKNDIELALSSEQLKMQTDKINELYIDMQKERKIVKDKWDGMSKFKYKMAIISKNNLYGVINENYKIVFDYNPDIMYIEILSFDTILLENKNNEKFLYNINTKETTKYSEDIQLANIKMLKENIYRKQKNGKCELYINNKLYNGLYDDIYIKDDLDIIILEKNGKVTFIDTNGNELLKLNSDKYFIIFNDIYYKEKNEIFIFSLKTLQSKLLGDSLLKTDDNKTISCKNKETFSTYKYYYHNPETNEIILCKKMKYGIVIEDGDVKVVRWFDSSEKRTEIHKLILENMFPSICNNEDLPKIKKLKLQ